MSLEDVNKTIIAISSGIGPSAICVIRISGSLSFPFIRAHIEKARVESRRIFLGNFSDGTQTIDQIMYVCYAGPNSYTGEDMVEIYAHGSPWIGKEIVSIGIRWGLEQATAGEFTRKAVLNKKISLEQAESLGVLLTSPSQLLRRKSLQILCGDKGEMYQNQREQLQKILVTTEASLEFGERDVLELSDIALIQQQLREDVVRIRKEIHAIVVRFRQEQKKEAGISVALVGRPNAGKSSIMNALLKRERMIISDAPGTTRDFVRENVFLEDVCFTLIDTAGLRSEGMDPIEEMGITKTKEILEKVEVICYIATDLLDIPILEKFKEVYLESQILIFFNKRDTLSERERETHRESFCNEGLLIEDFISTFEEEDMDKVKESLRKIFYVNQESFSTLQIISERQAVILEKIEAKMEELLMMLEGREELVIFSQKTQEVLEIWDELGMQGSKRESVLEEIFSQFCVGK